MKTFNLALLTAIASASDYSILRTNGDPVNYPLIATSTNHPTVTNEWSINVQCTYDNDTGFEWVEIEHVLVSDIMSTDLISFELAFTSKGDPFVDRVNSIAYDSGLCNLSLNAADTRFWV